MNGFGGLSEGYKVGAAWRERRLREKAMMESTGTNDIQSAYAQQMLKQQTQRDAEFIFKMYQMDPQAAVKAFNEHPILGASFGPIQYHPDHKILTTGSGGILDVYQDNDGKMHYDYEQVVPLSVINNMKKGDKVKVSYELPNGVKIEGSAKSLGLDPDGDNVVSFDEVKEVTKGLPEQPDIQNLMRQQDAATQSLNAVLKKGGMMEYQGLSEEDKAKADELTEEIETIQQKINKLVGSEKAPPPNPEYDQEMQNAYDAIAQGADAQAVKNLFKERTGKDLPDKERGF